MSVKEVYSIRLSKNDEGIKEYLEQFPVKQQTTALKMLLKFAIGSVDNSLRMVNELKNDIQTLNENHERRVKELKELIANIQTTRNETTSYTEPNPEGNEINFGEARESMQEALSMFMG